MNTSEERPRSGAGRWRAIRFVTAAVVSPFLFVLVGGFLTADDFPLFWNVAWTLVTCLVVAFFAVRVARRDAPWAVAIGLGTTLGVLALFTLVSVDDEVTLRSSVIVLFFVAASILLAYWLSRRTAPSDSQ